MYSNISVCYVFLHRIGGQSFLHGIWTTQLGHCSVHLLSIFNLPPYMGHMPQYLYYMYTKRFIDTPIFIRSPRHLYQTHDHYPLTTCLSILWVKTGPAPLLRYAGSWHPIMGHNYNNNLTVHPNSEYNTNHHRLQPIYSPTNQCQNRVRGIQRHPVRPAYNPDRLADTE